MNAIDRLTNLLRGRRVVVLSGAGCSTESGIPDYRGPDGVQRPRQPIQYQEFMRSAATRARYWARSAAGWRRVASARPNAGHSTLAQLEHDGLVQGIITQNVDGLHHAAGSRRVIELHGTLHAVRCVRCDARSWREEFQDQLLASNPGWADHTAQSAPDGDAEIDDVAGRDFMVPDCECGGFIKPDVVFFGENVPRATVATAWTLFEEGEVLLVVGSSLAVYSGRRFTDRARLAGKPIAVINCGPTRADDIATAKVDARIGDVLPGLAASLAQQRRLAIRNGHTGAA